MSVLRLGTRASKLARWQAAFVCDRLRALTPAHEIELVLIQTTGDRDQESRLAAVGGTGVFVRELELALADGRIDLAVHSLKDVPTEQPPGLAIVGFGPRADARDALVSRTGAPLRKLPEGARIGTGSLRRIAQLRALRPDFCFADLRGNVDTRLAKLDAGQYDAIVLAAAGLTRLGLAGRITEFFTFADVLPAPAQGIVGLEARVGDTATKDAVAGFSDAPARQAALAERALLATVEAGCHAPLGALATPDTRGESLELRVFIGAAAGDRPAIHLQAHGPADAPEALGHSLGLTALAQGARELLTDGHA